MSKRKQNLQKNSERKGLTRWSWGINGTHCQHRYIFSLLSLDAPDTEGSSATPSTSLNFEDAESLPVNVLRDCQEISVTAAPTNHAEGKRTFYYNS